MQKRKPSNQIQKKFVCFHHEGEKKGFMLRLSFPKDLLHRRFFRIHQNQQTNTRSSNLHAQQLPSFPKFRRIRLDRKGDEEEGGDETEKRRER